MHWKFNFNCFFTPLVHGFRHLVPCTLFSAPGDVAHYIPRATLPLESWSQTSELTCEKSALCTKWWPHLWVFATADFSFIFQLLGYYLVCCESLRSGCNMSLNYLQMRKLWNRKGQLNLSPSRGCCQWRMSRHQCKEASGSGLFSWETWKDIWNCSQKHTGGWRDGWSREYCWSRCNPDGMTPL